MDHIRDGAVKTAVVATSVLGVAEIVDAFFIEVPVVGIAYGLLLLGLAAWVWRRGSRIALGLVVVLAVFELVSVVAVYGGAHAFAHPGEDPLVTARMTLFLVLTVVAAVTAGRAMVRGGAQGRARLARS